MTDRTPLDHLTHDQYDDLHATITALTQQLTEARRQADASQAAIRRVRQAAARSFMAGPNAVDVVRVSDVRDALDGTSPAATQATDTPPSRRAGLRNEIAAALEAADYSGNMRRGDLADAILPVLYQAWPWLRAEAEEVALDPELQRQRDALIKALGASETENADLRRALIHCPHKEPLARIAALAEEYPAGIDTALIHEALGTPADPADPADAETTTRVFAALQQDAEATVTRVIALYERWVKTGVPLGVPFARWYDARLVELHDAIIPPGEESPRTTVNNPPTSKDTT